MMDVDATEPPPMPPSSLSSASNPNKKSSSLFQVYLRLRPATTAASERFLSVEEPSSHDSPPRHITLNPPNDRRRAIEKFAFTQVFEEDASQLDLFHCTGVASLVEGILAPRGGEGTDALLATLGVTGSGKTHTILGSRAQRGMTQLALEVIFRSLGHNILDADADPSVEGLVDASDPSEAAVMAASTFLDTVFADPSSAPLARGGNLSRAPTPMIVRPSSAHHTHPPPFGFSANFYCPETIPLPPSPSPSVPCHHHPLVSFPSLPTPSEASEEECELFMPKPKALKESLVKESIRVIRHEDSPIPAHAPPLDPPVPFPGTPSRSGPGRQQHARADGSTYLQAQEQQRPRTPAKAAQKHFMAPTASIRLKNNTKTLSVLKGDSSYLGAPSSVTGAPASGAGNANRKLLQRPTAFPQQPDVSSLSVSCDRAADYVVVVSMYEVYNDRIFDLLTPAVRLAATKEYRRRPLLFKPTEASPDRKVVAGLRKIVCASLSQALMVLEAGLHERRVAGTGSNSVSSRSHGFFCIEVRKRAKQGTAPGMSSSSNYTSGRRYYGGAQADAWSSSTLTIVDLAGSERARDAKTAGATLAEAGKINESLMYLGQCLQMQSDTAGKDKPSVVPFRQCKLTELLFSNAFPSTSSQQQQQPLAPRRNPQRGVMVVTVDPHGDFNATSQILRYSALAREITVPRIPSITQSMLWASAAAAAAQQEATAPPQCPSSPPFNTSPIQHRQMMPPPSHPASHHHQRPHPNNYAHQPPGRNVSTAALALGSSPSGLSATSYFCNTSSHGSANDPSGHRGTMELAALEIARLTEDNARLQEDNARYADAHAQLADELDCLRGSLAREKARRDAAEQRVDAIDDKIVMLEQAVRADCAGELERRLDVELARLRAHHAAEMERAEDHWACKIGLLEASMMAAAEAEAMALVNGAGGGTHERVEDKENVLLENAAEEMDRLRRENDVLRRELVGMSPTKRMPLQERRSRGGAEAMAATGGAGGGSPRVSSPFMMATVAAAGQQHRRGGSESNGHHSRREQQGRTSRRAQDKSHPRAQQQQQQQEDADEPAANLRRKLEKLRMSDDGGDADDDDSGAATVSNTALGRIPSSTGSPKKMRKLAARPWEGGVEDMF